ncbi:putative non-specific serine/threonine protein kinase [Rosa chinensis]|uniref:Putative non-specific serine/threonine protein kinase n=1 Tax=Rosa chinensis TaxID=74649 RepID=A0A2P6QFP9_ROSCH|nr:pto-interacting protein 1 isoform X2 [Rosa chinensis]PRQ32999.1 putative non-specific serine/threonine protein kinase [Rosa chinensis]
MRKATDNGGAYMMKNPAGNEGSHHASGNVPKGGQAAKVRPIEVPLIQVEELKEITDNFGTNALIGEGSYGRLYYGVLKSREHAAIKKLDATKQPDEMGPILQTTVNSLHLLRPTEKICSSIQGSMQVLVTAYLIFLSTTAKREICIPLFYYHSKFGCKFHYALGLKKMQ